MLHTHTARGRKTKAEIIWDVKQLQGTVPGNGGRGDDLGVYGDVMSGSLRSEFEHGAQIVCVRNKAAATHD